QRRAGGADRAADGDLHRNRRPRIVGVAGPALGELRAADGGDALERTYRAARDQGWPAARDRSGHADRPERRVRVRAALAHLLAVGGAARAPHQAAGIDPGAGIATASRVDLADAAHALVAERIQRLAVGRLVVAAVAGRVHRHERAVRLRRDVRRTVAGVR